MRYRAELDLLRQKLARAETELAARRSNPAHGRGQIVTLEQMVILYRKAIGLLLVVAGDR